MSFESLLAARFRPAGRPVGRMGWGNLLFLHWVWDPEDIQKRLPPGLTVDLHGDRAWLGVVPLFMNRVHPVGLPPVPWLSWFMELNVRTYVVGPDGTPGVWFFSLACHQPLAVEIARRAFHLNYVHARMRHERQGAMLDYLCQRSKAAEFRYKVATSGREAEPRSLEFFLVERYVLFSADQRGKLHAGRVHHAPYLIAPASVEKWSFQPAAEDGFSSPGREPDHAMVAVDQSVDVWPIYSISD